MPIIVPCFTAILFNPLIVFFSNISHTSLQQAVLGSYRYTVPEQEYRWMSLAGTSCIWGWWTFLLALEKSVHCQLPEHPSGIYRYFHSAESAALRERWRHGAWRNKKEQKKCLHFTDHQQNCAHSLSNGNIVETEYMSVDHAGCCNCTWIAKIHRDAMNNHSFGWGGQCGVRSSSKARSKEKKPRRRADMTGLKGGLYW